VKREGLRVVAAYGREKSWNDAITAAAQHCRTRHRRHYGSVLAVRVRGQTQVKARAAQTCLRGTRGERAQGRTRRARTSSYCAEKRLNGEERAMTFSPRICRLVTPPLLFLLPLSLSLPLPLIRKA